jgi:hypothetical protein
MIFRKCVQTRFFRKVVKVVQYCCVLISEFNIMKTVIRLAFGRRATAEETKDWFTRFKMTGSALSTSRMVMRLALGLDAFNYFLK